MKFDGTSSGRGRAKSRLEERRNAYRALPDAPRHVAIIMDGNGRWAVKRHLPRKIGHKKGVEALRAIVREAGNIELEALTLYAFSSENWRRSEEEIGDLIKLLHEYVKRDSQELYESGVKLQIIGDYSRFGTQTVSLISEACKKTRNGDKMRLTIALNYGGRDEIVRAVRDLAWRVKAGLVDVDDIDETNVENTLDTSNLPPLDILIRTSGERRLSNFLLWQSAYAELFFVESLWPDFTPDEFLDILYEFQTRERRYGGR